MNRYTILYFYQRFAMESSTYFADTLEEALERLQRDKPGHTLLESYEGYGKLKLLKRYNYIPL